LLCSNEGCTLANNGSSYIGKLDRSRSHAQCKSWKNHKNSEFTFPDGSERKAKNYCRYADGHFVLKCSFDTLPRFITIFKWFNVACQQVSHHTLLWLCAISLPNNFYKLQLL